MYTNGKLQRYNQSWLRGIDTAFTDIADVWSPGTADDITEFLAEFYIEVDVSRQK